MKINNPSFLYFARFIGAFCILYLGTKAVIGLSVPGGYYSSFVHDYADYPTLLRNILLYGSKLLLSAFGYQSYVHDSYYLRMSGGRGVHMVYSCLGIGLMSFWTAFIFANRGSFKMKFTWIFAGLSLICLINIGRVTLLVLALNKKWPMPFNLDNHTLFNVAAYCAIFMMIYFFSRRHTKSIPHSVSS